MKKQRVWPLARVTRACRSAPAVWLALEHFSVQRGSPTITPTRGQLTEVSGIQDVKSVSKALGILDDAGWITRVHVPVSTHGKHRAMLLRITLRRKTKKTPLTEPCAVRPKKRPSTRSRKTQKTGHPPSEGGGLNGPAPTAALGSEPSRPIPYVEPPPIVAKQPVDKKTHNTGADS